MAYLRLQDGSSITSVKCLAGLKTKIPQGIEVSWNIEGMEDMIKSYPPGKDLSIGPFKIKNTRWSVSLWPNGQLINGSDESKGNIFIGVCSGNPEGKIIPLKWEYHVGKSDYGWVKSVEQKSWFSGANEIVDVKLFTHNFFDENKKKLMNGGRLEFMVRISFMDEKTQKMLFPQVSLQEDTSEINRLRKLADNLSNLLWDESTSDFQILCGDNKFLVHRNVLKARSSFFNGLLSNDFADSNTGHIVIADMDSDTLKSLLEYIYTGRLKDLASKPIQLLKAADMYDLPLLKKSCEEELMSAMNLENVVDLFVLADEHSAVELRMTAKNMILENKAVIVEQDSWDVKLGTLVIELFKAI